jgi:D-sedoheptulose 7-phosphate isomerase
VGRKKDRATWFDAECEEHAVVLAGVRDALVAPFHGLVQACAESLEAGGKLLLFGNGGSAADAQHLATELTVRYREDRDPIAAVALSTDSSALTAAGNDLGFERIFARQIEALGRKGDVAIGISTSGKSPNVLLALRVAREMGLVTVALTGRDGGELPGLADHCLIVPSNATSRIQEMHILVGHALCGALEAELGLVS